MKILSIVAALLLLLPMTSCVIRTHTFADRNGTPDAQELEKAYQEKLASSDDGVLADMFWCPMLAMNLEVYNAAKAPMQSGTTYSEVDAFGPLFMFADGDAFHYDEKQELYEREIQQTYFWGLYRYGRNDVRVPSGWRQDEESSILFGLLRWPSKEYITGKIDG